MVENGLKGIARIKPHIYINKRKITINRFSAVIIQCDRYMRSFCLLEESRIEWLRFCKMGLFAGFFFAEQNYLQRQLNRSTLIDIIVYSNKFFADILNKQNLGLTIHDNFPTIYRQTIYIPYSLCNIYSCLFGNFCMRVLWVAFPCAYTQFVLRRLYANIMYIYTFTYINIRARTYAKYPTNDPPQNDHFRLAALLQFCGQKNICILV